MWAYIHQQNKQDIILGSFYCPPGSSVSVLEELQISVSTGVGTGEAGCWRIPCKFWYSIFIMNNHKIDHVIVFKMATQKRIDNYVSKLAFEVASSVILIDSSENDEETLLKIVRF